MEKHDRSYPLVEGDVAAALLASRSGLQPCAFIASELEASVNEAHSLVATTPYTPQ
jgi:hypothetical protein